MVLGQAAQRVPHGAEAAEDVVRGPRAQLWSAEEGEDAWVLRAELMTGGGWCMYVSANFERLVLGCINAELCNEIMNIYFSAVYEIDKV